MFRSKKLDLKPHLPTICKKKMISIIRVPLLAIRIIRIRYKKKTNIGIQIIIKIPTKILIP